MPVRRRKDRRRAGEVEAWYNFFWSGCDFFDDLPKIGLTEEAAYDVAEEIWHRIGNAVIDHIDRMHEGHPYPPGRPYWAEEQFGAPQDKKSKGVGAPLLLI